MERWGVEKSELPVNVTGEEAEDQKEGLIYNRSALALTPRCLPCSSSRVF